MAEDTTTTNETAAPAINEELVYEALRECYDPEIPVNVVDLGLIYQLEIDEDHVHVIMTLTSIGCPIAGEVMADVEAHVTQVPGVKTAHVELTFDPPWTPDRMSEDAKWELGIA